MTANITAPPKEEETERSKCGAYLYQGRIKCPNCQCPANMYPIENSGDLLKNKRNQLFSREMWASVGRNVFFLGLTSLLTDISSEMVTATLPLYLLLTLRLAPLQFGLIDGINQGASVLVRIASGLIADRYGLITAFYFLVGTIIVANVLVFFTPVVEREEKTRFVGQPAE